MLVRAPFPAKSATRQKSRPDLQSKYQDFELEARYHYGSVASIGGGNYPRRLPRVLASAELWRVAQVRTSEQTSDNVREFFTLEAALDAWDDFSAKALFLAQTMAWQSTRTSTCPSPYLLS